MQPLSVSVPLPLPQSRTHARPRTRTGVRCCAHARPGARFASEIPPTPAAPPAAHIATACTARSRACMPGMPGARAALFSGLGTAMTQRPAGDIPYRAHPGEQARAVAAVPAAAAALAIHCAASWNRPSDDPRQSAPGGDNAARRAALATVRSDRAPST